MKLFERIWLALVVGCTLSSGGVHGAPTIAPAAYQASDDDAVRIIRDRFGVPHVIASNTNSLFFGAGYALAEDQIERLSLNYMAANGRLAEVAGPDELQNDTLVRLLQLPRLASKGYAAMSPARREMLDAYVAGINHFINSPKSSGKPEWVKAVKSEDAVAFALYVNAMFAVEHCIGDLRSNGIRLSDLRVPAINRRWGSNQFAISANKSATGACMLSMDPHLPHSGFFLWHEMHLVGPEINAMGASLIGLPFIGMGRTPETAWCMTVNAPDLGDIFVLDVNPTNGSQYKTKGGWKTFEITQEVLRFKTDAGMVDKKLPILRSDFGPIITVQGDRAYAIKMSIPPGDVSVEQGYRMMIAKNVGEFKAALEPCGLLMFNILYADKHGSIFYVSNGRVGKRSEKIDSHQLRPANEAWAQWNGIHSFDELPQIENPTSGFLMNTNSGPQNVTVPGAPNLASFPRYMIGQRANSRSRRLNALLTGDDSIDWDELVAYATDTRLEADAVLEAITKSLAAAGEGLEGEPRKTLDDIVRTLQKWDRRADVDSRGTVLLYHLVADPEFQGALNAKDPQQLKQHALRVAKKVRERFGKLDVAWGEFSRISRGSKDHPMAGWPSTGNVGSTLRPIGGVVRNGKHYCLGGSSYGMLVDFSGDTRSVSCLPFGVSEKSDSPHFDDMLPLYTKRRFKPTSFLPADLKKNTKTTTELRPN